jgi:uncharacterized protein (UPF0303 family)
MDDTEKKEADDKKVIAYELQSSRRRLALPSFSQGTGTCLGSTIQERRC